MEEVLVEYLLAKGGIMGVLLALAMVWIVYRERIVFSKKSETKEEKSSAEKELKRIYQENLIAKIDEMVEKYSNIDEVLENIEKKTEELWNLHNVKDHDGVPVWYVRKSLEESINNLADSIDDLKEQTLDSLNHLDGLLSSQSDATNRFQHHNENRISELKVIIENYNKTMNDLSLALEKIKFVLKHNYNHRGDN